MAWEVGMKGVFGTIAVAVISAVVSAVVVFKGMEPTDSDHLAEWEDIVPDSPALVGLRIGDVVQKSKCTSNDVGSKLSGKDCIFYDNLMGRPVFVSARLCGSAVESISVSYALPGPLDGLEAALARLGWFAREDIAESNAETAPEDVEPSDSFSPEFYRLNQDLKLGRLGLALAGERAQAEVSSDFEAKLAEGKPLVDFEPILARVPEYTGLTREQYIEAAEFQGLDLNDFVHRIGQMGHPIQQVLDDYLEKKIPAALTPEERLINYKAAVKRKSMPRFYTHPEYPGIVREVSATTHSLEQRLLEPPKCFGGL
jgi:hypothetical protein